MDTPLDPNAELDLLGKRWTETKQRIGDLRNYLAAVEERISELVGVKEEGSTRTQTNTFKFTTTGGLIRTLDQRPISEWQADLGSSFDDILAVKLQLKVAGYRRANDAAKIVMDQNMTIKPKRPTVKVEMKGDDSAA